MAELSSFRTSKGKELKAYEATSGKAKRYFWCSPEKVKEHFKPLQAVPQGYELVMPTPGKKFPPIPIFKRKLSQSERAEVEKKNAQLKIARKALRQHKKRMKEAKKLLETHRPEIEELMKDTIESASKLEALKAKLEATTKAKIDAYKEKMESKQKAKLQKVKA